MLDFQSLIEFYFFVNDFNKRCNTVYEPLGTTGLSRKL